MILFSYMANGEIGRCLKGCCKPDNTSHDQGLARTAIHELAAYGTALGAHFAAAVETEKRRVAEKERALKKSIEDRERILLATLKQKYEGGNE